VHTACALTKEHLNRSWKEGKEDLVIQVEKKEKTRKDLEERAKNKAQETESDKQARRELKAAQQENNRLDRLFNARLKDASEEEYKRLVKGKEIDQWRTEEDDMIGKFTVLQKAEYETSNDRLQFWKDWTQWTKAWAKIVKETFPLMGEQTRDAVRAVRDQKKPRDKIIRKWRQEYTTKRMDLMFETNPMSKQQYEEANTTKEKTAVYRAWEKDQQKKRQREGEEDDDVKEPNKKKQRTVKCKEKNTLHPERLRTLPVVVEDLKDPHLDI
jgi:hypothetical protein